MKIGRFGDCEIFRVGNLITARLGDQRVTDIDRGEALNGLWYKLNDIRLQMNALAWRAQKELLRS